MKKIMKFSALVAVLMLAFSACDKHNNNQNGNEDNNNPKERVIVYMVEQTENRQNLETEGEWDVLLDMLCDQAMKGHEVTFYNMNPTTYLTKKDAKGTKAAKTFSTTDRDEMKAWMKKMEEEGHTGTLTAVGTDENGNPINYQIVFTYDDDDDTITINYEIANAEDEDTTISVPLVFHRDAANA